MVGEQSCVHKAADGERLPLPELHHLLRRGGRRNPEGHDRSDSGPRERCQSRSHEIPPPVKGGYSAALGLYSDPRPAAPLGPPYPFTAPIVKAWMKRSMKRV